MSKLIRETKEYIFTKPEHDMDMNYHIIDKETGYEYLVDIEDVIYDGKDIEDEYSFILWEEFKQEPLENAKEYAWRVLGKNNEDITEKVMWRWA